MVAFDINGRFLTQAVTGVQRHARSLVIALDHCLAEQPVPSDIRLLAPPGADLPTDLRCIRPLIVGHRRGQAWEQWDLPRAARDRALLSLCNTGPLRHRRHVATIHDASVFAIPDAYSWRFRAWYRFLLPRLARRARAIFTDSRFSACELARHLGLPEQAFTVVPLGSEHLDAVPVGPLPAAVRRDDGRPMVLLVASRSRHKNFAAAAAVAARLRDSGAHFVATGGTADGVFGAVGDVGTEITALGYVDDGQLRALYRHARVLLYPSRYEGFGLPPLEAMRHGCAVVTTNAASLPEVCGDAALYASPDDVEGLSAAVRRLIEDDVLHAEQVRRGHARADAFRWRHAARLVLQTMEHA